MHAPFTSFSGTIGKLVYKKYKGKTVVTLKPDSDRPLSQAETDHRQFFTQAAAWTNVALQDEELGPFYEALGKQRAIKARAAAMSDALKRPTLEGLDLSNYAGKAGDQIYFMATDNVGLTYAMVTIGDGNTFVFESGQAAEVDAGTGYWMYTARKDIPDGTTATIKVKVSDRPGNIVELTEEKSL